MKVPHITALVLSGLFCCASASADEGGPHRWTGLYAGLNIGGDADEESWQDPSGYYDHIVVSNEKHFPSTAKGMGMAAGGQMGVNFQSGAVVYGVEGQYDWTDLKGDTPCQTYGCNLRTDGLFSVTGRLGYSPENALYYVKAGLAGASDRYRIGGGKYNNVFHGDDLRLGETVGAGIEYPLDQHWSLKGEYDYLALGSETKSMTDQYGHTPSLKIGQDVQMLTMGVNYRFGKPWKDGVAMPSLDIFSHTPQPLPKSDWVIEMGPRYWYSSGTFRKTLFAPGNGAQMNSRLTYSDLTTHTVELFGRASYKDGLFLKGNVAFGAITGGKLQDEDFPPGISPYSSTNSQQHGGGQRYATLDVGDNLFTWKRGRVGLFTGYQYLKEEYNAFGCDQTATNTNVCIKVPPSTQVITETQTWQSMRLGLDGAVDVTSRWRLSGEFAYLPMVYSSGADNHWLRANIDPLPETAHGSGVEFEGMTSWQMTDNWSLGVGGRYWRLQSPGGHTQFPGNVPSPQDYSLRRYGAFMQASYKFGA